jgi:lipopolysaccharide transport system permease protein
MQLPAEGTGVAPAMVYANPMIGLVAGFRAACLGMPIPWTQLAVSAVTVLAVGLLATAYFRKVEDDFADII